METKELNRLIELLHLSESIKSYIQPIHMAKMEYLNGSIYVSCENKKGKDVPFKYKGKTYKFMVLSEWGTLETFLNEKPLVINE